MFCMHVLVVDSFRTGPHPNPLPAYREREPERRCRLVSSPGVLEERMASPCFQTLSRRIGCWLFALLLVVTGCATSRPGGPPEGPDAKSAVSIRSDTFGGVPSRTVSTPHYLIQTTIEDEEVVANLAQVMEGALAQYRKLSPAVPMDGKPLQCFVFANRNQWAQFTESQTGSDAKVYLRI